MNGSAISHPTPAAPGDSIELGATTLRVLAPSAPLLEDTRVNTVLRRNNTAAGGLAIEIISGPAAGSRIPVGSEPFILGRAETGTGSLGDDPELSRRHASVSLFGPGRLVVEDLDSTNGTFVNDHRILMPTLLKPGDAVRLGTTTLRIVGSEPAGNAR